MNDGHLTVHDLDIRYGDFIAVSDVAFSVPSLADRTAASRVDGFVGRHRTHFGRKVADRRTFLSRSPALYALLRVWTLFATNGRRRRRHQAFDFLGSNLGAPFRDQHKQALTRPYESGWRDSNPRPLDPQLPPERPAPSQHVSRSPADQAFREGLRSRCLTTSRYVS